MFPVKNRRQKLVKLINTACLLLGLGIVPAISKPQPVFSAERIKTFIGPLQIAIAVDSLEAFAKEGIINPDLALVTNRLDGETVVQLREILQERFDLGPAEIYRVARVPMVERMLSQLGRGVQISHNINGLHGLRAAMILAAADETEGLTIINALRKFPSRDIYLNLEFLLQLRQELATQSSYRQAVIAEIIKQSATEAAESTTDLDQLSDLQQPGSWAVSMQSLKFEIESLRSTDVGLSTSHPLEFDLYLPQGKSEPAPLIFIVQGFGSSRGNYSHVANQLASHGYAVASVEHIGSNLEYRQAFLRGELGDWITPIEFVGRTLDVTNLLDKLEELDASDPNWSNKLNLEQVGIFGYSFGGYTALATAGAEINQPRLDQKCNEENFNIVISFALQCQAQYLPPIKFNIKDPRIKAVFAAYPFTNPIFGPEGMGKIDIPTMIWAASEDTTVPVVPNQIHPFFWLSTPDKYLALLVPGTHYSTAKDEVIEGLPLEMLRGPEGSGPIARDYLNAMTVAFFNYHLRGLEEFEPYLSASYTEEISRESIEIHLTHSLTPEQLETAYGKQPPSPLFPEPIVATAEDRSEPVLDEINRTGVLKVAVRSDAAPFGSLEDTGNWTGYCADFVKSLEQYLEQKLKLSGGIQTVELPSNLENRYELVQQDHVHLECGPNTIRNDLEQITFSNPFFASGTQFLVTNNQASQLNGNSDLANLKIGVLKGTTTETFVKENYPSTATVFFDGSTGRAQAVKALNNNEIEALVSDSILSIGELERQSLDPAAYTLLPRQPLTCDYYGMLLPDGDRQWRETINSFLRNQSAQQASDKWLGDFSEELLSAIRSCNRQR
ncbi:putative dienelactone hydrolase [Xenococcus sp. PCC 7305]|uniref:alpha/beta hydrolase n=1 Tax=Xenococcus sp. PCC 7305 TaxID=102125 RepID=UPI0002AC1949|nr:alpha/beta hydrolase [Xenococcus sp. PCC 7305]ELS03022.1 putative dienelactone hydrolase [Xenococcus sp. PCC 7305]